MKTQTHLTPDPATADEVKLPAWMKKRGRKMEPKPKAKAKAEAQLFAATTDTTKPVNVTWPKTIGELVALIESPPPTLPKKLKDRIALAAGFLTELKFAPPHLSAQHWTHHAETARRLKNVPSISFVIGGGTPLLSSRVAYTKPLKRMADALGITVHRWKGKAFMLKKTAA